MTEVAILCLLAVVIFLLLRILRVLQLTHAGLNFQAHIREQFAAHGKPTRDDDVASPHEIDYAALAEASWNKTVKPAYGHGWDLLNDESRRMHVGLVRGAFDAFFERAQWQKPEGIDETAAEHS